ncbi:MAG TPA: GNAT family N-acetyltransferase [Capsulimonadaceae bacterium]|jgi:ribosomal protein S18 acetylase RimI-like enzyme
MAQKYELIPFRLDDAALVADWLLDADDVAQVTGERRFPVDPSDIVVWSYEASRAYLLIEGEVPVAYGELVEDEADGDIEIGHVVIAPDSRSGDAGRDLLAQLVDKAQDGYPYDDIWLRVSRSNARQLRDAAANGFTEEPEASGENFIWLRKTYGNHS